jgi:hypothetical protein
MLSSWFEEGERGQEARNAKNATAVAVKGEKTGSGLVSLEGALPVDTFSPVT